MSYMDEFSVEGTVIGGPEISVIFNKCYERISEWTELNAPSFAKAVKASGQELYDLGCYGENLSNVKMDAKLDRIKTPTNQEELVSAICEEYIANVNIAIEKGMIVR